MINFHDLVLGFEKLGLKKLITTYTRTNLLPDCFKRANHFIVQTPQTFDSEALKRAYQCEYEQHFTDDATVMESAGETITLVEGDTNNIKITYLQDIATAESILTLRD